MITSWTTYDTPEELETLKQRAKAGEQIYIKYNGKTLLLMGNTDENGKHISRKVNKREVENMYATFRFEAFESGAETENRTENTSCNVTTSPTINETEDFDRKFNEVISRLENLEKAVQVQI